MFFSTSRYEYIDSCDWNLDFYVEGLRIKDGVVWALVVENVPMLLQHHLRDDVWTSLLNQNRSWIYLAVQLNPLNVQSVQAAVMP